MSKGSSGRFHGTHGNPQTKLDVDGVTGNRLPDNRSQLMHIFADRPGHIPDTPRNRQLIEALANDRSAFIGIDRYGKAWYARTNANGTQTWASTRDGIVRNCGMNETPNPWDPETGLSKNLPKRPSKRRKQ